MGKLLAESLTVAVIQVVGIIVADNSTGPAWGLCSPANNVGLMLDVVKSETSLSCKTILVETKWCPDRRYFVLSPTRRRSTALS